MAAPTMKKPEISLPVLQTSTSHRVHSDLMNQPAYNSSDDEDLPAPPPELLQYDHQITDNLNLIQGDCQNDCDMQMADNQHEEKSHIFKEDEAAERLQSKYASPGNIIVPPHTMTNDNDNVDYVTNGINDVTNGINAHLSIADNKELSSMHVKKSKGAGSVSAFSDASSDMSDATTSAPSATSSGGSVPAPVPVVEGATESDIQQVEMFYRSQKTDVRVCRSLANMYLSAAKTVDRMSVGQSSSHNGDSPIKSPDPSAMSMEDWDFIKTGIPILVLNTGEHLRSRKLSIILAEKGTGFSLWEDVILSTTNYETPHVNFHTLTLSTDHSRLVGFSFDEANAATEFAEAVNSLIPKPEDVNDNDKKKKKKKEKKPKQKYKPPRKIDISQPCCFVHVTKLERTANIMGIPSSLFPPPPNGAELSQVMLRSQSQSSELSDYSTSPSEH